MSAHRVDYDLRDVLHVIARSRAFVATILLGSFAIFVAASFMLPKRYKATGIISIQTDYFRYPLIEEFLPSPTDPAEIVSKRDALVRSAFTREFLGRIGEKYGLIEGDKNDPRREQKEEDLFRRFEIFSLSQTTVQIAFWGPTPVVTRDVTGEAVAEVTKVLSEDRVQKITRARDNILEQTERMALKQDPTKAVLASRKPEVLRAELNRLEGEIATLASRFSARHPSIARLEERAKKIREYLAANPSAAGSKNIRSLDDELPQGGPELYDGLVKKLAYLNVALALESDQRSPYVSVIDPPALPTEALWPRKPLFAVWGLLFGALAAALALLAREGLMAAPSRLRRLADNYQLPLLGEVPELPIAAPRGEVAAKREVERER